MKAAIADAFRFTRFLSAGHRAQKASPFSRTCYNGHDSSSSNSSSGYNGHDSSPSSKSGYNGTSKDVPPLHASPRG